VKVIVSITVLLILLQPIQAQTQLSLEAPLSVQAGEALNVTVHAPANSPVTLRLYNGIRRLATSLTASAENTAVWHIPANIITGAGTSQLIASVAGETVTQAIRIYPTEIDHLDFLTTANNLAAYGEARGMLIALASDTYGNPAPSLLAALSAQYPSAKRQTILLPIESGFGWRWFTTEGPPGRVRLNLNAASVIQSLELMQMPTAPSQIELSLTPECVVNDGRDVITLYARVEDRFGSVVVDSTLVKFTWERGEGSVQVFNGNASLRVPAPTSAGNYQFTAASEGAVSAPVMLKVQAEACE
jgi:hypothetical protein